MRRGPTPRAPPILEEELTLRQRLPIVVACLPTTVDPSYYQRLRDLYVSETERDKVSTYLIRVHTLVLERARPREPDEPDTPDWLAELISWD